MPIEDTINPFEYKLKKAGLTEPLTTYLGDPQDPDRIAAGFLAQQLDTNGVPTGVVIGTGGIAVVNRILPVNVSRSLTPADFERDLSLASGVVLTIPTDAVLGITEPTFSPNIVLYAAGAGAFSLVTTGLIIRGANPTFSQYRFYGIKRVGPNEWAYV